MSLSNKIFDASLNEVIPPQEIKDNYVVVCQVSKIIKDGTAPLEEVREQIISKISKIKKLDIVKTKIYEVNFNWIVAYMYSSIYWKRSNCKTKIL